MAALLSITVAPEADWLALLIKPVAEHVSGGGEGGGGVDGQGEGLGGVRADPVVDADGGK